LVGDGRDLVRRRLDVSFGRILVATMIRPKSDVGLTSGANWVGLSEGSVCGRKFSGLCVFYLNLQKFLMQKVR